MIPAVGLGLMPPVVGRVETGRLMRFPPVGRPVVALTGSSEVRVSPGFELLSATGIEIPIPLAGVVIAPPPPATIGVAAPWPTSWMSPEFPAHAPPHETPRFSRANRSSDSSRASILTWGRAMSSVSRMSFLIRSRSRS